MIKSTLPIITCLAILMSVVYPYAEIGLNYNFGTNAPLGLGVFYPLNDKVAIGTNISVNPKFFNRTGTQPSVLFNEDIPVDSFTTFETIQMNLIYTPFDLSPSALGVDIGIGIAHKNRFKVYKENKPGNHDPLYFNDGTYKVSDQKEVFPFINISMAFINNRFFYSTGYSFLLNEMTIRFGYRMF